MAGIETRGFVEVTKHLKARYGTRAGKYFAVRASQYMEDQVIQNNKSRTYDKSNNKKLTGRLLRGLSNKEYDQGLTREIISNPQIAGANFNYGKTINDGHNGIEVKTKKVLAVPVNQWGYAVNPYGSKKLPVMNKSGTHVILGKKTRPYKGTQYFSDAIKATKRRMGAIARESIKKLWK